MHYRLLKYCKTMHYRFQKGTTQTMKIFEKLEIKHLDKFLEEFSMLSAYQPKEGWIRTIRKTLHMSTDVLSKKLNLTITSVLKIENREKNKCITLKKLEEAAQALDCKLIYALIPNESFLDMIRNQERLNAIKLIQQTQNTMKLEQQGLDKDQLKQQLEYVLQDIQNQPLKKLWKNAV